MDVGVKVTRDMAAAAHAPGRDEHSRDSRVTAFEELEAAHQAARKHRRRPFSSVVLLYAGKVRSGKTAMANMYAVTMYEAGYQVASNASLMYGYRISAEDVYTYAEALEPQTVVVVDEAHSLADIYGENSQRQRTLAASTALMGKNGNHVLLCSAHANRVALSIAGEAKSLIFPEQTRRHFRYYPSWCHMGSNVISPYPLQSRRLESQFGLGRPPKKRRGPYIHPALAYAASRVYDSFDRPALAGGMFTEAKDIRQRLKDHGANGDGPQEDRGTIAAAFFEAIAIAESNGAGLRDGGPAHWRRMMAAARSAGWEGSDDEARWLLRDTIGLSQAGKVRQRDLKTLFEVAE